MKNTIKWFLLSGFFAAVAISLALLKTSGCASSGAPGTDIKATRCALKKLAAIVTASDQTGDVAAIVTMLDTLTPLMQKIDAESNTNSKMRACHLASAHIAEGALSIYSGERWRTKDRFESAISNC